MNAEQEKIKGVYERPPGLWGWRVHNLAEGNGTGKRLAAGRTQSRSIRSERPTRYAN